MTGMTLGQFYAPRPPRYLAAIVLAVMTIATSTVLFMAAAGNKSAADENSRAASKAAAAGAVSFSRDIQPIFNQYCVICHQGAPGAGELSLEPGISYASLMAKSRESKLLRVSPGAPAASYLAHKLAGTQGTVKGSGDRMPFEGTPLNAAQMGLIQQWITQGALNN